MRLESPIQGNFRLARRTTGSAASTIPAGTTLMVMKGAANRDPTSSTTPTTCGSTAPTAASTSASASASTRAPARRSRAPRAG